MYSFNKPQQNTGEFLKNLFLSPTVLSRLMLINLSVYLIVNIVALFAALFNASNGIALSPLANLLALPADLSILATKPWTIITYMFLHEDLNETFLDLFIWRCFWWTVFYSSI